MSSTSLMGQFHFFDVNDAKKYGVHEAIILQNIKHWVLFNKQNNNLKNFHEGRYWTFNSIKNFRKNVFKYFSERQISWALAKLKEMGAILEGSFNEKKYDATKWYTLNDDTSKETINDEVDDAIPLTKLLTPPLHNDAIPLTKLANGSDKFVKPIPDINTDIKQKRKKQTVPTEPDPSAKQLLEYWNSKNIIRHTITDTLIASIAKAIRKRAIPLEAIKQAVDRYAEVLYREDCFWSYKWNLRDFLTSKTALRFYIEEFDIVTYISSSGPKKGGQGEWAKLDDDSPITDKGALILDSILAQGKEQYLKKGLDHEHLP